GDFKSLAKEADESLAKHKTLELEIKRVLREVKLENENVELEFQVLNYARENAHLKTTYKNLFDSISMSSTQTKTIIASLQKQLHNSIYKNAKLRAQLFIKVSDQKDNKRGTSANTKFAKQSIVENLPKVDEKHALSKPVTSNSDPTLQESKLMKNDKVIAPGMFRINPFKTSREAKHVPNNVRASVRTKPITVSQHPVITKKDYKWKAVCFGDCRRFSRCTWVHFLRSKDEAPEMIKTFLKRITVLLQVFNRRTKKIMETINVSFDELLAMAFEQRSLKPRLQSMTSGQISSGFNLTYAPSTITTQQPTEGELNLLFEAMYDDYIGGQPSATARTILAAQAPQDVDELSSQQQQVQQQGNQAHLQSTIVADDVPHAMFNENTFVNPFAHPSTSAADSSSSQNVDPLNMHTFYQPYPHEFQWTKDHPLEQVIGEPSRAVITRSQLLSDGDMCMYALTVNPSMK
nr:hypothetical protein [Tanacetum cinerariifolium]